MLAMSRALMSDPKVLLLDEPSMGLAPVLVDQIFDTISAAPRARHDDPAGRAERPQGAPDRRPRLRHRDRQDRARRPRREPARQRAGPEGLPRHRLIWSRSRHIGAGVVTAGPRSRLGLTPERRRDGRRATGCSGARPAPGPRCASTGRPVTASWIGHRGAPARVVHRTRHARAGRWPPGSGHPRAGPTTVRGLGGPALEQLEGPGVEDPDAGAALGFGARADGEQELAVRRSDQRPLGPADRSPTGRRTRSWRLPGGGRSPRTMTSAGVAPGRRRRVPASRATGHAGPRPRGGGRSGPRCRRCPSSASSSASVTAELA